LQEQATAGEMEREEEGPRSGATELVPWYNFCFGYLVINLC